MLLLCRQGRLEVGPPPGGRYKGEAQQLACLALFTEQCGNFETKPWVPYRCLNLQGVVTKELALNFISHIFSQVAAFHAIHYQEKLSSPAGPEHLLPSETFLLSREVAFPQNYGHLS